MSKPNIAIVDTGSGNLRSVEKALALAGADPFVTQDADRIARADKVVVPGQGAFGACMAGLTRNSGALRDAVLAALSAGKPYLGICMGLQVLFDSSEEEPGCKGLGVFRGRVERFKVSQPLKVPHMGWNACRRAHGGGFCAAVARDNLFACQFHPEKSQRAGIGLLSRFVSI